MPLEWIIFQIFINTVEVGALFYLLCNKFESKSTSFIPTILFVVVSVVVSSLRIFIHLFDILPVTEIFIPIVCIVFLCFFREGRLLNKLFWSAISFVLIICIAFLSITIISIIGELSAGDIMTTHQQSIERFLVMTTAKTLQVIVFYILAKKKRNYRNNLSPLSMLICFSIPLISFIVMFCIHILLLQDFYMPYTLSFTISVSTLLTNIMVFILYEIINQEAEKTYVLVAQNKQYGMTKEHNKQVVDMYDRMREWRHDYNHHMQLVVGMLEKTDYNKNVPEAITYIKELDNKIKSISIEIITGNVIVDAIISVKATLSSIHDVEFKHSILLTDDISAVDDTDLCSILSNLLDNAIEACCKLNDNRYIHIEMLTFKNQLSIKITNSANGDYKIEKGVFKTTKKGDLHGIGMGHVKSIVERYDGIFDVTPASDSFTTSVSISIG